MSEPSFVLDAYAARSCELKTVNAFTPGLVAPQRETRLPGFFHDAGAVEEDVFGRLRSGSGTIVDLRGLRGAASEEQETAALQALADGVDQAFAAIASGAARAKLDEFGALSRRISS